MFLAVAIILALLVFPAPVYPQCSNTEPVLLYQIDGDQNNHYAGFSVAGVGDVNADGRDDFIIGRPGSESGPLVDAGSALVYSGLDGSILHWINGENSNDQLGWSVAGAGDVNGDGRPDFMVGAPFASPGGVTMAGSVYVFSGLNGALLYKIDGDQFGHWSGWSVAGVGDVNADGRDDFIIGRPASESGPLVDAGSALVYSGLDGSILHWKNGENSGDFLGYSVAGAGDINGDGRPDFIIGAPYALSHSGLAYVFSGLNGALLYQKTEYWSDGQFGSSVAGSGDVDGDGRADFIVGSLHDNFEDHYSQLFSGMNGGLYWEGSSYSGNATWISVAGTGDVNGDGRADFIVGNPDAVYSNIAVTLYSGSTGYSLHDIWGYYGPDGQGTKAGRSVAGVGDVNGDGNADYAFGAPNADPNSHLGSYNSGSVFVYAYCISACSAKPGDANASGTHTLADAIAIVNYIFNKPGCTPTPSCWLSSLLCRGDWDGSTTVSLSDVIRAVNFIFNNPGGPWNALPSGVCYL